METLRKNKKVSMKKMKRRMTATRGITLIALVITIIVLLILAGVMIATLTGENGILNQAGNAKTSNAEGEAREEFALIANEWAIEKNTSNKTLGDFLNEKLTEGKLTSVKDNENGTYTIKQNGYQTIINQNGEISDLFNPEEWDKTACKESSFLWESDDPNSGEAYYTIVGYADSITNETKLKIPSRCHEIRCDAVNYNNQGRTFAQTFNTVELPDTMTKIGNYAFSHSNLTGIMIPNNVTSIGDCAFSGCSSLTSVEIPNGVISIGVQALSYCESLTSVTIPNSVISIGAAAFCHSSSLTSITIPNSVRDMGQLAFTGWSTSQTINIQGYSSAPSGWNSRWNEGCFATINWRQ